MPGATLGLLFGIWLFQQQPVLWSPLPWLVSGLLGLLLAGLAYAWPRNHWQTVLVLAGLRRSGLLLLMVMLGFSWAQGRAWWRLQSVLPAACEQQVLRVQAVIVGVPALDARGQHVDAMIERGVATSCILPAHVRLHLYQQQYRQTPNAVALPVAIDRQLGRSMHPARQPILRAGERWLFSVRLKRPHATRNPHGFDYAAWSLVNQLGASGNIVSKAPMQRLSPLVWQPSALIAHWRASIAAGIERVLAPSPQRAVIRALVIGDDSQLGRADWQLFVDSGINHLISISGLHITMLASLGYALVMALWRWRPSLALWRPSRQVATLAGAAVAIAYAALAGFSVPTQRTLYMLLSVAVMLNLKRQWPLSWILSVAAWAVVLLDPWAVLAPGFWLSFGAVAVLAFAMGGRLRAGHWWGHAWRTQWAVTVAFMPVLLLLFNQVSLLSPLANALAIPLVSLAVVPLAIAGAVFSLDPLLVLAANVMAWTMHVLVWLMQWPWAVWYQATPALWAWALAMLGVVVLLMPRGWPLRWAGVLCCLPLGWSWQAPLTTGQMRVTVLDVGQGLSVLVQTANHHLLYDAGPAYGEDSDAGQRIVLPYLRHLGIRQLDIAMVSHDDADHVGGMASVLAGIQAHQLVSSLSADAHLFTQLQAQRPHSSRLVRQSCYAGQHWQWDGIVFTVLGPAAEAHADIKDNDKSCVLHIQSAHGSLLLTGDIEKHAEYWLVQAARPSLPATVMTMPHHGSKTSSSPALIAAVSPQLAIASVGYLNRFGHPKADVLARYHAAGVKTLRSDQSGAVLLDFVAGTVPQWRLWRQEAPHYWEHTALSAL